MSELNLDDRIRQELQTAAEALGRLIAQTSDMTLGVYPEVLDIVGASLKGGGAPVFMLRSGHDYRKGAHYGHNDGTTPVCGNDRDGRPVVQWIPPNAKWCDECTAILDPCHGGHWPRR